MKNIENFICTIFAFILFVFLIGGFLFIASFLFVNISKFLIPLTGGIAKSRYEYQKELNQAINGNEVKPIYKTEKVICFEKYNVATNSSSLSCVNKKTK